MIMKNGAPIQTFTRITEKRAQFGLPSQFTPGMPKASRIQLNALYEGSNSHSHARVLIAGGITQGTSNMPRHLRWPLVGMLCTKCATQKPISALNRTALMANTTDCLTTIQNVSRLNRNSKLSRPTKCSIDLFSVARWIANTAGYSTSAAITTSRGNANRKPMVERRSKKRRARPRLRAAGRRVWPAAVVSIRCVASTRASPRCSDPHEAFEFGLRPRGGFLDRLAALRDLGDELGRDGLRVDLRGDLRRRREARDLQDLAGLGRVVPQRALGRAFLGPRLEVVELGERGDVVALACRNHLLHRGARRDVREQALGRRF